MANEPVQVMLRKQAKPGLMIFLIITIIVGIIYPLVITGIAQSIFPVQSNGNLIEYNGKIVGSSLIGQPFTSSKYFWGRLSATSPVPYNSGVSSGSNLGPTNPALLDLVKARVDALHAADPYNSQPIPVDLVTSSASGLDPDISVAAAKYQVPRIARERNLSESDMTALVDQQTENQQFGLFGEHRVNVLKLNLALDDLSAHRMMGTSSPEPQDVPPPLIFGLRMTDWIQLILLFVILAALIVPVGGFMAKVYSGERTFLSPIFAPVEGWVLSVSGVNSSDEMDWKMFAVAMIVFSLIGIVAVFIFQSVQQFLPLNPVGIGSVPWDLSLNTAVSFATNTNWQAYAGENGVSYLTQMIGLAVQNFMSAAVGMAVLIAFIYGFSRKSATTIGNFWVLLIRSIIDPPALLCNHLAYTRLTGNCSVIQRASDRSTTRPCPGHYRGTYHNAIDPAGTCCITDCNQAAWDKRGRFLQCKLSPPVREPHAIFKFPRDPGYPYHPHFALLYLRQTDRFSAKRDCNPYCYDHYFCTACSDLPSGRKQKEIRHSFHLGIDQTPDASPAGWEYGRKGDEIWRRPVSIIFSRYDSDVMRSS